MKFSEATKAVAGFYVVGTAAFYGRLTPDQWQQAHDDLEQTFDLSEELQANACDLFVERCRELVTKYSEMNLRPLSADNRDAIIMGADPDSKRFRKYESRRQKTCVACEGIENLVITSDKETPMDVYVICKSCKEKKRVSA